MNEEVASLVRKIHWMHAGELAERSVNDAEFRESVRLAIPQIIGLLGDDSMTYGGADVLLKISEQYRFRQSIRRAIPQIIALLSHRESFVRIAGADVLLKLSEQYEFRESIGPAIPHIITLHSDKEPSVCKAGADALSKFSEQPEFRESIRLAIPQIITLLNNNEPSVRKAGADVLLKFSEQAEFRESIRLAIPHIIALRSDSELSVRTAGEYALSKFLRQSEFRESVAAIPQNTALLRDINKDVYVADVAALAKLPERGINADTEFDIVDSDASKHFETITCWIAAEHALRHAKSKISAVSDVFKTQNIQESEYVVLAGFDECLIKSGIGYLEQIHVFVSTEIDTTSPILSELGRIFTPFSSILFTESSSYHLPVFKDDVNVWEFDELVYFTASKFADGGSSAETPLTVISLAHTPPLAGGPTDFSSGGSGTGEGDKNEKRRSEKGEERDRQDEGGADEGDENDEDPDDEDSDDEDPGDDPGKPSADKTNAEPSNISFSITSKLYPNAGIFQTLTMDGNLTITTTPEVKSPPRFSTRHVKFTELQFGTRRETSEGYKQFHVMVVVDALQGHAVPQDVRPRKTRYSDGEEKQTSLTTKGQNRGVEAAVTAAAIPKASVKYIAVKKREKTVGSEKKRYTSRITQDRKAGAVWWGFDVDDPNFQQGGSDMLDDVLPTVHFKFFGNANVPAPPPTRMDIVIASYWSMMLPSEPKRTWIRTLLRFFRSSGQPQTTSYSNLFQIAALKTVPSNLLGEGHYSATVDVRLPGGSDPLKLERPEADSVDVTPAVFDNEGKLRDLNDLKIAKFQLSDNCIQNLEEWRRERKIH